MLYCWVQHFALLAQHVQCIKRTILINKTTTRHNKWAPIYLALHRPTTQVRAGVNKRQSKVLS